jgi:hypothetical protein
VRVRSGRGVTSSEGDARASAEARNAFRETHFARRFPRDAASGAGEASSYLRVTSSAGKKECER